MFSTFFHKMWREGRVQLTASAYGPLELLGNIGTVGRWTVLVTSNALGSSSERVRKNYDMVKLSIHRSYPICTSDEVRVVRGKLDKVAHPEGIYSYLADTQKETRTTFYSAVLALPASPLPRISSQSEAAMTKSPKSSSTGSHAPHPPSNVLAVTLFDHLVSTSKCTIVVPRGHFPRAMTALSDTTTTSPTN